MIFQHVLPKKQKLARKSGIKREINFGNLISMHADDCCCRQRELIPNRTQMSMKLCAGSQRRIFDVDNMMKTLLNL